MSTHARDGFTTTWLAVEWAGGALVALLIVAALGLLAWLLIQWADRTATRILRPALLRRQARRSGRTPGA